MRIWLIFSIAFPGVLWALDFDRQQIQQRIQPVGKVKLQGEALENATQANGNKEVAVDKKESNVLSSEVIYKQYCAVCHQNGVAGAPVFQNKAQWKARLANNTLEQLVASAIKGKNAMPAKGTCNECSNDDMRKVVEYMLPK